MAFYQSINQYQMFFFPKNLKFFLTLKGKKNEYYNNEEFHNKIFNLMS